MFAILLLACAADPAPRFEVVNRCPQRFTVVNRVPAPAPAVPSAPLVSVCENGVCRLVPITAGGNAPQSVAMPSSCAGGNCAVPTSDGWHLGKNLGRRR